MDSPVLLIKSNNGVQVDSDIYVLEESIIKIGRDSTADLRISDPFISRLQAEIFFEHEKWFIRDIQSKNGTFLNSNKIGPEPVQIKNGDVISFSKKIEYIYREEDLDDDETRTISMQNSPYGIVMLDKSEDVIIDGIKINPRLGPQEWKFLSLLLNEPDRIHTYKELVQSIYMIEEDFFAMPPYLKMLQAIKNDIIKKFKKQGITRDVIKSRSGVGYQLVEKDISESSAQH